MADPRDAAAAALRSALLSEQQASGGWGQRRVGPPATESTALVVLALALSGSGTGELPIRRGVEWLATRQRPEGSWPATDQVSEPSWMTGDVLLTLSILGAERARCDRAAHWLLERRSTGVPWLARVAERWRERRSGWKTNSLDPSLTAWPWVDDTFGWVEPTALSLLALRAAALRTPALSRADSFRERVSTAERMLINRATPGGGWNYGNVRVYGEDLPPYPDTTAWALLALRGPDGRVVSGAESVVRSGLDRLHRLLAHTRSPLAHALGALALRAFGRDDASSRAMLADRTLPDGAPWIETRSRAFAILALAGPTFPFGV